MTSEVVTATLPDDQIVYAIGDVHGRLDLLREMLALIARDASASDASSKTLVFLGDYVDRGPDSCDVIELLNAGLPPGFEAHFVKGNHEQLMLDFLANPSGLDAWRRNGGESTMRSYGVDIEALEDGNAPAGAWRRALLDVLPDRHRRFLERLELQYVIGGYVFVHAGLRPGVPLREQVSEDLLWIRDAFLESDALYEKKVVHGHTPGRAPVTRPNRIGIDTGAVFTDRLTAVRLELATHQFLQTGNPV